MIASRFLAGVSGRLRPETAYGNPCLVRAGFLEGRVSKAYIDGVFPDDEYARQKKLLEMKLESLVVPQASADEEAGKLIMNLPNYGLKLILRSADGYYSQRSMPFILK